MCRSGPCNFAQKFEGHTCYGKLLEYFSSVGIPKIIRMDNFNTLKSETSSAIRDRIPVKFSAPYHDISHKSIERTNKTLEDILKKFLATHLRTWDELIPLLLVSIREVPNERTKFRTTELVYSRKLSGSMSLAGEMWTRGDPMERKVKM